MASSYLLSAIIFLLSIPLHSCIITGDDATVDCNKHIIVFGNNKPSTLLQSRSIAINYNTNTNMDTTSNPTSNPTLNIDKNTNQIHLSIPTTTTTTPTVYPTHTPSITPSSTNSTHKAIANRTQYIQQHLQNHTQPHEPNHRINDTLCLQPGTQCILNSDCCGNTLCKYNDTMELDMGICCVMNRKQGCLIDSDCCNSSDVCIDFVCVPSNYTYYTINNNISKIESDLESNKTTVKTVLFPKKLFFAVIFIPLLIIIAFGFCYKWYMQRKYVKVKEKNCNNDIELNKDTNADKNGAGKGVVLYNGFFGNEADLGDDDLQLYNGRNVKNSSINTSDIDSDETPIPTSFSMKDYLL